MAIGTIDCTSERKLCDEYNVRGYPTLKYSLHGTADTNGKSDMPALYEYKGGRKVPDIVQLGRQLTRPALQMVSNMEQALDLEKGEEDWNHHDRVVFMVHHPTLVQYKDQLSGTQQKEDDSKSTSPQAIVGQVTPLTNIFGQVARKYRATTEFQVLVQGKPSEQDDSEKATIESATETDLSTIRYLSSFVGSTAFVCRLERHVPVQCLSVLPDPEAEDPSHDPTVDFAYLERFVASNRHPTVTQLGPHNFQALKQGGRPLVIGVVQVSDVSQVVAMKQVLVDVATSPTHSHLKEAYFFCWMDGIRYSRFLEQFGIGSNDNDPTSTLPQLLVLDSDKGVYWHDKNQTYHVINDAAKFVQHVHDGTLESRPTETSKKNGNVLTQLYWMVIENQPWSIVWLAVLVILIALIITTIISEPEPSPPQRQPTAPPPETKKAQ